MADDPINLNSMTSLQPPAGLWDAISEGLDEAEAPAPTRQRTPLFFGGGMAAAAMLALTLTLGQQPGEEAMVAVDNNQLARIQAVSAAMDNRIGQWRGGVVHADQADVLARMERELVLLDGDIEREPANSTLWAERVALQSEIMEQYLSSDWRSEMMVQAY